MAISMNTPIDFAKIAAVMRPIVARWYNATVEIIDPNLRDQAWDMATNTYSATSEVIIYSGAARVQPLTEASTPDIGITQASLRGILVQVPYDPSAGLIRKGLQIRVTDGGEDSVLEDLKFVVKSAINSSYGWNRSIECEVDVKSVE
jgi:hypothetical protein